MDAFMDDGAEMAFGETWLIMMNPTMYDITWQHRSCLGVPFGIATTYFCAILH